MKNTKYPLKAVVAAAALSVLLLFTAVPPSQADDSGRCQQRIERAEARLYDAIHKHGEYSRQARDKRRDLIAEREHCWREHHAWWNAHEHQWHNDRDWDRDHDRDYR